MADATTQTETRPMLEQARETLDCVRDIAAAFDDTERRAQYVAEAQAEATLAVAEELRALREALDALTTRASNGQVRIRTMPLSARRLVERALADGSNTTTTTEGNADGGDD